MLDESRIDVPSNSSRRPWYRGLIIDPLISKTYPLFIRLHPNTISSISLVVAVIGYYLLLKNYRFPFMVLLQVSYYFDCLDGYVARATGRMSKIGRILDVSFDFAKISVLFSFVAYRVLSAGPSIFFFMFAVYSLSVLGRMGKEIVSAIAYATEKQGTHFNKALLRLPRLADSAYRRWCDEKRLNYFPVGVSEQIYLISPFLLFFGQPYQALFISLLFFLRGLQFFLMLFLG